MIHVRLQSRLIRARQFPYYMLNIYKHWMSMSGWLKLGTGANIICAETRGESERKRDREARRKHNINKYKKRWMFKNMWESDAYHDVALLHLIHPWCIILSVSNSLLLQHWLLPYTLYQRAQTRLDRGGTFTIQQRVMSFTIWACHGKFVQFTLPNLITLHYYVDTNTVNCGTTWQLSSRNMSV